MKKLFAVAFIALFSSCTTIQFQVSSYSVDYSEFNKQGVFLTEAPSVSFDYDPVGSVTAIIRSGEDPNSKSSKKVYDFDGNEVGDTYGGQYRVATTKDALQELTRLTKELGGDAIIGLKFEYSYGIVASGMAVKRK